MKEKNQVIKRQPKWIRKFRLYFSFPHIWVCLIILFCAVIALLFSHVLYSNGEGFISSLLSNVFAGLLTGFVICLLSGSKQIFVVKIKEKRAWLEKLSTIIQTYFCDYNRLLHYHFDKFDGNITIFDEIYDCGVHANSVNSEIIQSSFSKSLSFDTVRYCKNTFTYDAERLCDEFQDLHEYLQMLDVNCPSSKDIVNRFNKINQEIHNLNSKIYNEINKLDVEITEIQKSII